MALEYFIDFKVEKIVITRPVVEAGEKLGFLPGQQKKNYILIYYLFLMKLIIFYKCIVMQNLKVSRQIEVVPLGLMRGRSFHNSFIVADECQNASYDQLKMLLTRIGMNSKMVFTGDIAQSDLQFQQRGGFYNLSQILADVDGVGTMSLECSDILRNPIIGNIIDKINKNENKA